MKFLDTVNKDDSLYHYSLYLLGKTATDTTSYTVSDWLRSAKTYYRKAAYSIWRNASGWEFNDSNYVSTTNNSPVATKDLLIQQAQSIPTNALDIQRVEVMNNAGNYVLLNRMDKIEVKDQALSEYYKTNGLPKYYDVIGNSVMLYPSPASGSVTTTNGLKLYIARDISAPVMTTGNGAYRTISSEPGFHINFHPYIAIGCDVDYGVAKNYTADKMTNLRLALKEYEAGIADYYGKRDRDYPTKFRVNVRSLI